MGLISHVFVKDVTEQQRKVAEKAFENLGEIDKITPNRFELPINTLRRIYGDRFWDLKGTNSKDDVLRVDIESEGSFDINKLTSSIETSLPLLNFLQSIFSNFVSCSPSANIPVDPNYAKSFQAKVALTSESGCVTEIATMDTFRECWHYDGSGNIVDLRDTDVIQNLGVKIQKNNEAIQRLQGTAAANSIVDLNKENKECLDQMLVIYKEICQKVLDVFKKLANVEDVKDLYNVSLSFSRELVDETGKVPSIHESSILAYHSADLHDMMVLQNKFGVKA